LSPPPPSSLASIKPTNRVVFEAEASGEGGSKAGGLPHPSLSLSLPSPFPFPYILSLPVGGKVRSSEGEVPRLPPYKYHPTYKPRFTRNNGR